MKKSLIALAVAGAFAVPSAAMAVDVSFGGEFDLSLDAVDNGGTTNSSWNQMNNTHSRFWWDIVDDLGTGTKVKGHLELDVGANGYHANNTVNNPGSTTGIANRNSYIGLAGDTWGEVRFGTQENVYEAIGYSVDPFHGAAGPGGNIVNGMGQSGIAGDTSSAVCNGGNIGCRRTDSTITYISPNWSGFTFQVDYALEGPTGTGTSNDKWNELYYGARYDAQAPFGGWRVYGGGADITNSRGAIISTATVADLSGMRFGGGITWNNLSVDLIMESNEWNATAAGTKVERDGIDILAAFAIPTGKIAFGYLMMDDRDVNGASVASSATTNLSVGYYHTLSANSSLYVIYDTMDNDANAQSNIQNVGTAGVGQDPSAISLGMYLVF